MHIIYTDLKQLSVGHTTLFVGEPCFGTNGPLLRIPTRPELYHGLTENRRETMLVLFCRVNEVTGDPNPLKGRQRTCDSSGVAGIRGWRRSLTIRRLVRSYGLGIA